MKFLKLSFVAATIALFAVACNKNSDTTANEVTELADSDSEYEYENDFPDAPEIEDRAASLASITPVNGSTVAASDPCHNIKHEGFASWNKGTAATVNIVGAELGANQNLTALKGSASVSGYVKAIVYQSTPAFNKAKTDTLNCAITSWSATQIQASLPSNALDFDSLRNYTIKFIVGVPTQARDSNLVSIKIKSKTLKALGQVLGKKYGNNIDWDLYMLHKYGNSLGLPSGMSVVNGSGAATFPNYGTPITMPTDSANAYVPLVGDQLERADGTRGFVYGVGTKDAKGKTKVRIYQRKCDNTSLKKATWTYQVAGLYGTTTKTQGFVPKADETGGTWIKYRRKSE